MAVARGRLGHRVAAGGLFELACRPETRRPRLVPIAEPSPRAGGLSAGGRRARASRRGRRRRLHALSRPSWPTPAGRSSCSRSGKRAPAANACASFWEALYHGTPEDMRRLLTERVQACSWLLIDPTTLWTLRASRRLAGLEDSQPPPENSMARRSLVSLANELPAGFELIWEGVGGQSLLTRLA